MAKKYYQGRYRPQNPEKYKGDVSNIQYRSGWELRLCSYLDKHPKVLEWSSEEVVLPYVSPIDNRIHRYFPDFLVKQLNKEGNIETILIEVKPYAQTRPPDPAKGKTPSGRPSRRFLNEVKTWGVNEAKWKAAEEFCRDRKWKFQKLTEHDLGIK